MDRTLDEIVAERQQSNSRNNRRPPPRRNNYPRDGVRKSARDDRTDLDRDWVHDRYDDDRDSQRNPRGGRGRRDDQDDRERYPPETETTAKLRVDNLHWDVSEKELNTLFEEVGPVLECKISYDRAGRSNGAAYVTYERLADAKLAIREYDGANAKGQPIKLTLLPPSAPGGGRGGPRGQNPFFSDRVERPARSLFDRIERPRSASPGGEGRRRGPSGRERRSDMSRPAPEGIDRYVPGQGNRSPIRRPRGGAGGRRPGQRREDSQRGADDKGRKVVGGRPRMTAEELDADMADYWKSKEAAANGGSEATAAAAATGDDVVATTTAETDDIDMVE